MLVDRQTDTDVSNVPLQYQDDQRHEANLRPPTFYRLPSGSQIARPPAASDPFDQEVYKPVTS